MSRARTCSCREPPRLPAWCSPKLGSPQHTLVTPALKGSTTGPPVPAPGAAQTKHDQLGHSHSRNHALGRVLPASSNSWGLQASWTLQSSWACGHITSACPSIFPCPFLFFFFFKIYLFTFIFGLTGSLLLYTGFLQLRRVGATF